MVDLKIPLGFLKPLGLDGVAGADEALPDAQLPQDVDAIPDDGGRTRASADTVRGARERFAGSVPPGIASQVASVQGTSSGQRTDPRVIAQARDDLQELGYEVGPDPTRVDDPKTKEAIKQFQKDHGLPVTGNMDLELLMGLLEAMNANRRSATPPRPRPNSSWSSGRPGGTPGVQNGPRSSTGYQAPSGNFANAPAANSQGPRGPSNGPAPFGRVDLSTEQGKDVFRQAARLAGLPESWADSPALRNLVNAESGGIVGRPNYTYGNRDWGSIHNELKSGNITARSSATGLGQLLLSNVDRYYPNGRQGIGDPVQEAAGMMRYIQDRYGSPDVAWGNHSANPQRHQGVPRIYSAEGY